jgi:hypothetical protein
VTVSDPIGVDGNAWNLNNTGDASDQAISTDGGLTWFAPSGQTPGAFEVDGTLVAPAPGALTLLGSGALALLGGRWRRLRRGLPRVGEACPARRPQVEQLEARNLMTATGTWTPLTNLVPVTDPINDGPGTMTMLPNGSILIQRYVPGDNFFLLSPDGNGSYVNGSFSQNVAPMSTQRLYYSSNLLPNGKLFVLGGEYSNGYVQNWTNTGEIYDTNTNTWSPIATFPDPSGHYGDDPSMLLENGTDILTGGGAFEGGVTYIYHSATDTWSSPIFKVYNDSSDEETWVKLPNGDVLTYDIFSSLFISGGNNTGYAELFDHTTNTWRSVSPGDGTANGSIPTLSDTQTFELGPMMRLLDGRIFVLGDNGNTAFYNPSTNTWSAGPTIPQQPVLINGVPTLVPFGVDDAPAAELPNGQVIFAADPGVFFGQLNHPPQELFIFDPASNTIAPLPTPPGTAADEFAGQGSFIDRMQVLPTGQLLFSDSFPQMYVYTPASTAAAPQYKPVINKFTFNGAAGSFTLTGKQLNGQSAGNSYGDDVEQDENYPIVRFTNAAGTVYYATTSNWSTQGVATGSLAETVNVQLPAGMPAGNYSMVVSGAGIQSVPLAVNISAAQLLPPPAAAVTPALTQPGPTAAAHGSTPSDLAGVSVALTHASLANLAALPQHQAATATSTDVRPDLSHGPAPLHDLTAVAVATPQGRSVGSGASTKVLDALFADYFLSPF